MRKLFASALIIAALLTAGLAQDQTAPQNREELARLAQAPASRDAIGRAVIFVSDADGKPVKGAYATLESIWGGDHYCESFGYTNGEGAIALPPIHMGEVKLVVKAKGYQTSRVNVAADALSDPINVTLIRK